MHAVRPGSHRRTILTVGGITCLGLALSACTGSGLVSPPGTGTPAATPSSTTRMVPSAELVQAVFSRLPAAARSAPAFTWNSAGKVGQGEPSEDDDAVLLMAASCDSGGELTITVNGEDTVLKCSRFSVAGPINLTAAMGTDPPGGVDVEVRPTGGHPRYVAKAVAVTPAEADSTGSARRAP